MEGKQTSRLSSSYEEREKNGGRRTIKKQGAYNREDMVEGGKTKQGENTFIRDAGKLWNRAPATITTSESLWKTKKEIKKFAKKTPNLNIEFWTS